MAYHHGNLREALLDGARELIGERGASAFTLRELARRVGVSHAAPLHHFADRQALLTALATSGFDRLADELESVPDPALLEFGLAYVRVSSAHPAEFAVMFQPQLLDDDDEALASAQGRARAALHAAAGLHSPDPAYEVAAWSLAHGLSQLLAAGALQRELAADPGLARNVLATLTGPSV